MLLCIAKKKELKFMSATIKYILKLSIDRIQPKCEKNRLISITRFKQGVTKT